MSNLLEWESISEEELRAKIPGGWLVKSCPPVTKVLPAGDLQDGWEWRVAMVFVPDPSHAWQKKGR